MEENKIGRFFKFLLCSILLVSTFNCKNGKEAKNKSSITLNHETQYKNIVEDSIIYDFFNNVLLTENKVYKNCNYILESYPLVDIEDMDGSETLIPYIDSIFTREDLIFVRKQFKNSNYFKIDSTKIEEKSVISLSTYNQFDENNIYNEIPRNYPCILSIKGPFFNIKKNRAVIYLDNFCGFICGEYELCLYEKDKNNKWKLIKTLLSEKS